jgi:O-antigen ligase
MHNYSWFGDLNEFSISMTGKTIYSGREDIWDNIYSLISERPLLGYDESDLGSFFNYELTTHNYYLHLLLFHGWFGLILQMLIFYIYWLNYYKYKSNVNVKYSAAFLIAMSVHQVFENTLFMSNWMIIMYYIFSYGVTMVPNYSNSSSK